MNSPKIPFATSAPGKVIIFGEHSAVYNKPAIAAALSLRTYLLVTKDELPDAKDAKIILKFKDIEFESSWTIDELPWHLKSSLGFENKPVITEELIPELVDGLSIPLSKITSSLHYSSAFAFLYLFVNLCSKETIKKGENITLTVRSTLPIGAGLGSSASISVCLASALSYLGGHISKPEIKLNDLTTVESEECKFIDSWSFMGEKCIHGNPSGIDNAVSTHGGAVMFQRTESSFPSVRTSMRNFPSLNLLLTNTKVPRRTATLVGNVSTLVTDYPKISSFLLDAMESIVREAYNLMLRPFLDKESHKQLLDLIRINHGLLVSLGVSHPSLEKIKMISDELKIGETKLTGAGGGGCAITLLNDNLYENIGNDNEFQAKIDKSIKLFEKEGFETFKTTLGGKGAGILCEFDDKDEKEEINKLLTIENFINFESRDNIETTIGISKINEWRFW